MNEPQGARRVAVIRLHTGGPAGTELAESVFDAAISRFGGAWRLSGTATTAGGEQYWIETGTAAVTSRPDLLAQLSHLTARVPARCDVFLGELLGESTARGFDESASRYLLHVPYAAPAGELPGLDAWYVGEHDAMVMRCTDWRAVRRYAPVDGSPAPWTRLVIHELLAGDVLESPFVQESMASDTRRKFARRPWFLAGGRFPVPLIAARARVP